MSQSIALILMGMLMGGVFVAAFQLFKTREPSPDKEHERGYEDAKHFHTKRGVPIYHMVGYVKTTEALNAVTAYEAGMLQYCNEVLKAGTTALREVTQ